MKIASFEQQYEYYDFGRKYPNEYGSNGNNVSTFGSISVQVGFNHPASLRVVGNTSKLQEPLAFNSYHYYNELKNGSILNDEEKSSHGSRVNLEV